MNNILKVISVKKKSEFLILLLLILITSFLETFTIGVFLPFVTLILGGKTNIEFFNLFENNNLIKSFSSEFNELELIILSLVIFLTVFIIKIFFVIFIAFYRENFRWSLFHQLSKKILGSHISKNTSFFFKKNSSEYTSQTLLQSNQAVESINSLIFLINEVIVFLSIFTLLIILDYRITFFSVSVFILLFLIPFLFFSKVKIKSWASKQLMHEHNQIKNINESFSMFKYIKIHNNEKFFFDKYVSNNFFTAYYKKLIAFFVQVPRHYLELLTIVLISLIILFYLNENKSSKEYLPIIAIFMLAASRMVPSINKILASIQTFIAGVPAINSISREINKKSINFKNRKNFFKFKNLKLKNVSFSYDKNNSVLKKINLEIKSGDKIIVKGQSGVGKSTLIELILGLRRLNTGSFYLNDKKINNYKLYEKLKFNYLPQTSFMIDGSIKDNILLNNKLNKNEFWKIIDICKLKTLISSLKKKENTLAGENGVTLSGGQKQRICIARSLADNPSFLILDESTNAIDMSTENSILKDLNKYYNEITLIMVTHRKTNIKYFNKIIDMSNNKIKLINKNV